MKKFLSLLLAMTLVLSCLSLTSALAEPTKIRIAWLGLSENDTMDPLSGIVTKGSGELKALIESKLDNVEIEIVNVPGDGWIQTMEVLCTSGEVDMGWYTNQVLAAEWFLDNRELMANDPVFTEEYFEATFTPVAKQYTRYHTYDFPQYKDAIIGLPYDMGSYWYMYDAELFEQWGVEMPAQEDLTFEKLLELAQKTTGINPVTGQQNYGCFIRPYWCEWVGVGFDMYKMIDDDEMDITKFDIAANVDYIKDSPEVLRYFNILKGLIECCPPGAASNSGWENFMTADNNIAIMLDCSHTNTYLNYLSGGMTEVTDRFKPFLPLTGELGVTGFPEVHHVAICKNVASDKLNTCWEISKLISTDTEIQNWLFKNYAWSAVPALVDTTGLDIMDDEFVTERYQDRLQHSMITDDYWHWREPLNAMLSSFFAGQLTPEQAREQFHADVTKWVQNKQAQVK